jgi:hypothetical protein
MIRSCLLLVALVPALSWAQISRSDYEVKDSFERRTHAIREQIQVTQSTAALDSLKSVIDSLASAYGAHRGLLDKALYPETFGTTIAALQQELRQTYDRVFLIETQGARIGALEMELAGVIHNLDSLSVARNAILGEISRLKKSNSRLQESVRRLSANLEARDQLIFALVDTVFKGYSESQAGEVRSNAINQRLGKVNALERIYDVAANSIQILDQLHPSGKDYTPLIAQYERFKQRWLGLRERLNAAYSLSAHGRPGEKGAANPGGEVDSLVAIWDMRLLGSFWSELQQEFRDVPIHPFRDAQSFTESITFFVDSVTSHDADGTGFVATVWKDRIDREWRDALSIEGVMGKADYAALDRKVSELGEKKVDAKFLTILAILVVLLVVTWVMLSRKKGNEPVAAQGTPPPQA